MANFPAMKCSEDIKKLAISKLEDAQCLLDNNRFDSAFYLAGYSVELLLKAKVCKNLGIEDFFDFADQNSRKIKPEAYKPFKVHEYQQLIVLSGMYGDFEVQLKNAAFKGHWSVIGKWSEDCRYLTGKTETETKEFVTSIREVTQWILTQL
jgi:HEPN domain-containing protein